MASLAAYSWQSAICEEYQSIQEAGTWRVHNIASLRAGRLHVGSKCVFKVQHNADGSVARYKAWIVPRGYWHIKGLDYDKPFALVTRYDCLCLIIALATHLGLDSDQLDYKSAFRNGDLVENIWMIPQPGIGLDWRFFDSTKHSMLSSKHHSPGSRSSPKALLT